MRRWSICMLSLTGCAQVFGLDSPAATNVDASISDSSTNDSDPGQNCWGDNFDDNMIDANRWVTFIEGMQQVVETDQQLHIVLDNTSGSAYSGLDTKTTLATDAGVEVEVVEPTRDNATETALALFRGGANQLVLTKDGANLRAVVKTDGVNMFSEVAWDAVAHHYFRIERAMNDVTFSTSSDGMQWDVLWRTTAAFATQPLRAQIYAGHYMQVPATKVVFDNFKVLDPACMP
ncbi:MAG TPA: hypothetical protein VIV11_03505 [Kofleriaceae bacterium]